MAINVESRVHTIYPNEIDNLFLYRGEDVDPVLSNSPNLLARTIIALENKLGVTGGIVSSVGGIEFTGVDSSPRNLTVWVNKGSSGDYNLYYTDDLGVDYLVGGPRFVSSGGGSGLSLGETSITAYRGDRGKVAYDHSQVTGNPHSSTKSDIGLSNVPNVDCSITSNISDGLNKRFVTDAQLTIIGNTSGVNTGDSSGHENLVPTSRSVNGHVLTSDVTITKSDLSLGNVPNLDCSTTLNISSSTDKRFVTDSQLTIIGNTSGENTGDQIVPKSISFSSTKFLTAYDSLTGDWSSSRPVWSDIDKTGATTVDISSSTNKNYVTDDQLLVIESTSGINTGDSAGHSSLVPDIRTVNGHVLSSDVTVTKNDVSLGNVPNLDCSTTSNISDSLNKRFVTDAQLTVIGNTSGINTGDSAGHSSLVPTSRTVNGHVLTSDVTITKSDLSLGNVPNLDCSTTSNITDSLNKRFATDSQLTALEEIDSIVVPQNSPSATNNFLTAYDNTTGGWSRSRPTWDNIDKTGATTADISSSTNKNYVTDAQLTVIGNTSGTNTGDSSGHENLVPTSRSVNGHTLISDVTITKNDVSLGNVPNVDCSTTSNISSSTDKRFVTDAQLIVIGNTSGVNTGDSAGHSSLVPNTRTVNGYSLSSDVTITKSDLSLGNVPNLDCSTTSNISDSLNKRFVTDAQLTVIGNTSGTNTGDQIVPANSSAVSNNFLTAYNNTTGAWTRAQPTWANIDKSTSSIADIITRSHTSLSDIGTNSHSTIDTFISSKAVASGLASLNSSTLVVQNPANATATPTAGKIPIADGSGKLDGWVTASGAVWGNITGTITNQSDLNTSLNAKESTSNKAIANGYASLDSNSLVVQNPVNATATPTAGKIPIADGSGKLDGWVTASGGGNGYTLSLRAASQSTTTDGQTLYWGGMLVAPSTTANRWRVYIPKAGTIKYARVYSYSGTAGSAEAWAMNIRKNNTSDTLIQSLSASTNDRIWSNDVLNIAVVAGDYLEIKEVCPTWATNPATVTRSGVIYIE